MSILEVGLGSNIPRTATEIIGEGLTKRTFFLSLKFIIERKKIT